MSRAIKVVIAVLLGACVACLALYGSAAVPTAISSRRLRGQFRFEDTPQQKQQKQQRIASLASIIWQIIYGVLFYFLVSSKYPELSRHSQRSSQIMNESPVFRCPSGPVCLQAFFCQAAVLANVTSKTKILNYWVALVLAACCPQCGALVAFSCNELEVKLGGQKKNCVSGVLEAIFCTCCLTLQAQEALDAATGATLGCCSVASAREIEDEYAVMPADAAASAA